VDELFLLTVTAGNIHSSISPFQLWLRHGHLRETPEQLGFYPSVYAQEMQVSRKQLSGGKQVSDMRVLSHPRNPPFLINFAEGENGPAGRAKVNIEKRSHRLRHFRNGIFATSAVDANVEIVFVCDFYWFHHGRAFSSTSSDYIAGRSGGVDHPDSLHKSCAGWQLTATHHSVVSTCL
jgi:hypothetical protein